MATSQTRSAAFARRVAPFLFFAPALTWALFQLRDTAMDAIALSIAFGFAVLAIQVARDVYAAWRIMKAAGAKAWSMLSGLAEAVRSYHLGLRRKFVVLFGCTSAAWSYVIYYAVTEADSEAAVVAAIAGFTATVGWTISSYITARNTQRQNTITLLLNMRNSDIYSRHFNNAYYVALNEAQRGNHTYWYELDLQVKWKGANGPCEPTAEPQAATGVRSAYQSVIYVLNYFEFIAAGVRSNALDAGIVRQTISGYLRYFFTTFECWITAERKGSAASFEHLLWYCGKFPARG